jgi:hypothetical protein
MGASMATCALEQQLRMDQRMTENAKTANSRCMIVVLVLVVLLVGS